MDDNSPNQARPRAEPPMASQDPATVTPAAPRDPRACSFVRRLAAMCYDSLLLTAVLFAASFALLALTDGNAIESGNFFYKLFLLALAYLYFTWHWVKGGQTLGMRSWHVFVVDEAGHRPGLKPGSIRFAAALLSWALLGLGFIWALFDSNKQALHDRLSKTRLVVRRD